MTDVRLKLAGLTGDDLGDLPTSEPEFKQVLPPQVPPADASTPTISEAAQALLIMCGCQATFVINYWRVTRRRETGKLEPGVTLPRGKKYREATGVSANAPFAEWQEVLSNFTGAIGNGK